MPKYGDKCTFPGCDNTHLSKGFCSGHYKQYMGNKGTLTKLRDKNNKNEKKPCVIDGCESIGRKKKMCMKHYEQVKRIKRRASKKKKKSEFNETTG